VCEIVDSCLQRNREKRPTAGALCAVMQSATRQLRAERFRHSGGRRQGDQQKGSLQLFGLTRVQFSRAVMVGAASGLLTGLLAVMLGYLLLR
jgi:hypothetical protein